MSLGNGTDPLGRDMSNAVILGREYRITLPREAQKALKTLAAYRGWSEHQCAQYLLGWAIDNAMNEYMQAVVVSNVLCTAMPVTLCSAS